MIEIKPCSIDKPPLQINVGLNEMFYDFCKMLISYKIVAFIIIGFILQRKGTFICNVGDYNFENFCIDASL